MSKREVVNKNAWELAEFLESLPAEQVNMGVWTSSCGTTKCIAGWIDYRYYDGRAHQHYAKNYMGMECSRNLYVTQGREFLGITQEEAENLFLELKANREKVINTLRHLALTGEVDWDAPKVEVCYADAT